MHDRTTASIWLIDFAKTVELPEKVNIDHNSAWTVGNHEDGYLIGINNMIDIFNELLIKKGDNKSPPRISTDNGLFDSSVEKLTLNDQCTSPDGGSETIPSEHSRQRSPTLTTSSSTPTIVKTNSTHQIIILDNTQLVDQLREDT